MIWKRGGREPFEYQTGCKFPSYDIYAKLTNEVLCAMEHFNLNTTNQQLQRFLFVKNQWKRRWMKPHKNDSNEMHWKLGVLTNDKGQAKVRLEENDWWNCRSWWKSDKINQNDQEKITQTKKSENYTKWKGQVKIRQNKKAEWKLGKIKRPVKIRQNKKGKVKFTQNKIGEWKIGKIKRPVKIKQNRKGKWKLHKIKWSNAKIGKIKRKSEN